MKSVILDAFAVLAWVNEEPGADFVERIVVDARRGRIWVGICTINLGEVYYRAVRLRGLPRGEAILRYLLELGWHVLPVTNELVWAAARLKARFPISYADAFALACAQEHDAALVTNDPELVAADHGVPLLWEKA